MRLQKEQLHIHPKVSCSYTDLISLVGEQLLVTDRVSYGECDERWKEEGEEV